MRTTHRTAFQLGPFSNWRLLEDELLQFGWRRNEANITALLDNAPDPPVDVVLFVNVEEVADVEGDGAPVDGRVVVLAAVVHHVGPDGEGHRFAPGPVQAYHCVAFAAATVIRILADNAQDNRCKSHHVHHLLMHLQRHEYDCISTTHVQHISRSGLHEIFIGLARD